MLQNNRRPGPNGGHVERAKIDVRERAETTQDESTAAVSAELREAVTRLMDGRELSAVRQDIARVEGQRDGLVALLRAVMSIVVRIDRCETLISDLHELAKNATPTKDWYSVSEISKILGKAEFTVREWCRLGRVQAAKRECGRGNSQEWIMSHEELIRIQNEGLLPD
jgi:hypothetical protein